jgi:actin-related protein 3
MNNEDSRASWSHIPDQPPVVIDIGAGYTKSGYACNSAPDFIIPSVVGTPTQLPGRPRDVRIMKDLDFYIGIEAVNRIHAYSLANVVKDGQIDDWDKLEQFLEHCLFKYLRCDPEDHGVLLTASVRNSPDYREFAAEMMFETLGVPYL